MAFSGFPFALFIPFIVLGAIYFVLDSISETPHWVEILAKVLPDYSLVLAAFFIGKNESHGPKRWGLSKYSIRIMIALVFCSGGDIFLDVSESTFPVGVGCFLVAHLFFMSAYLIERPCRNGTPCCLGFSWQSLLRCIPAYGYALTIFGIIVSGVPKALIGPLLVYMLALSTMVCCAWSRVGSPRSLPVSQFTAALGAPIFMVSDSLIGLTTFHGHIPGSGYLIMATYYVGIGLITASCYHAAVPDEVVAGYSAMPASFVHEDEASKGTSV